MEIIELLDLYRGKRNEIGARVMFYDELDIDVYSGKKLKDLRTQLGFTQKDISSRLKIAQSAVSKIENETGLDPETRDNYLAAINVSPSDFSLLMDLMGIMKVSTLKALTLIDKETVQNRVNEALSTMDQESTEHLRNEFLKKVKSMSAEEIKELCRYYRMMKAERYMKKNHLLSKIE